MSEEKTDCFETIFLQILLGPGASGGPPGALPPVGMQRR